MNAFQKKLVENNAHLIKIVAGKLVNSYGERGLNNFDELCGYGAFGLIDAAIKFDPDKNVQFTTYASLRIRGAILDGIRKDDWISRGARKKAKEIQTMYNDFELTHGRFPSDEEASQILNISIEKYREILSEISSYNICSMEEMIENNLWFEEDSINSSPEQAYAVTEQKEILTRAIEDLRENEKMVITLYYYEDLSLKEISKVLNVSESRVSQIHSKAILKLKNKLSYSSHGLSIF